jgi:hypothetical protein
MNIIERQVNQVTRDGDTFVIPPFNVCRRSFHLTATVLYDLMQYGCSWSEPGFAEIRDQMALPKGWKSWNLIEQYVLRKGRVVIDEWIFYPHTYRSHIEPIERKETDD